jgi:hypothetical protein
LYASSDYIAHTPELASVEETAGRVLVANIVEFLYNRARDTQRQSAWETLGTLSAAVSRISWTPPAPIVMLAFCVSSSVLNTRIQNQFSRDFVRTKLPDGTPFRQARSSESSCQKQQHRRVGSKATSGFYDPNAISV